MGTEVGDCCGGKEEGGEEVHGLVAVYEAGVEGFEGGKIAWLSEGIGEEDAHDADYGDA